MVGDRIVSQAEFLSDKYKMDNPKRGRAYIINKLAGNDQDYTALHQRFSEMGFEIHEFSNVECLDKAAADDEYNRQADCFVCVILVEEGSTDSKVDVRQLIEPFKGAKCKGLVGKPKIFFIQTWQKSQLGRDTTDCEVVPMVPEIQVHKIPSEADFLIVSSVVPGSLFIQALSEVLINNWKDLDLLKMMTRVNNKINYEFDNNKEYKNQKKQLPLIKSMLTKLVQFSQKD